MVSEFLLSIYPMVLLAFEGVGSFRQRRASVRVCAVVPADPEPTAEIKRLSIPSSLRRSDNQPVQRSGVAELRVVE